MSLWRRELQKAREFYTGADRAQLGGIFGNLGSAVDQITGKPKNSRGGSYHDLEEQNFDNTFGSNLVAGSWKDAAEFIVSAQTEYNVGYGAADTESTVGRWFATLDDGAGNTVTGQCRIVTRNANDKAVETDISGVSTSRLNKSNPTEQYKVPEVMDTNRVGEDSKIVFQFKLDSGSAGTSIDFTAAATEFRLSLTEY